MHGRRDAARGRAPSAGPASSPGAFLAGTFFFFIGSLTRTTVANTNVLMSVSPFLAALAARCILREPVPRAHVDRDDVAFAASSSCSRDSLDAGRLAGNLLALGVSCCFAAQVTVLRKFHATVDMLPQVMIAGVVVARRRAGARAGRSRPRRATSAILALMGCVQLGTGCLLATAASQHLSATELGLLALLEPILGPIWVWVLMGEHPGAATLAGGAIVLAAVIANEAFARMARTATSPRRRPALTPRVRLRPAL